MSENQFRIAGSPWWRYSPANLLRTPAARSGPQPGIASNNQPLPMRLPPCVARSGRHRVYRSPALPRTCKNSRAACETALHTHSATQHNRNTQAPALDRYVESRATRSPVGMVSARRMLIPCFRAVEMTERMVAKISAPATVRKPPEIFILSFIIRMSCSA
jgi:hypothetical protein